MLAYLISSLWSRSVQLCERCERPDDIDHPALRAMSPRELADLPFPRDRATDAEGGPSQATTVAKACSRGRTGERG